MVARFAAVSAVSEAEKKADSASSATIRATLQRIMASMLSLASAIAGSFYAWMWWGTARSGSVQKIALRMCEYRLPSRLDWHRGLPSKQAGLVAAPSAPSHSAERTSSPDPHARGGPCIPKHPVLSAHLAWAPIV